VWIQALVLCCGLLLVYGCGHGSTQRDADGGAMGAATEVTEAERGGQHVESLLEMLQGRVPGLQAVVDNDGTIRLQIRGATNLLGEPQEPLLVIDGMPVPEGQNSREIQRLSAADIDRVEVLRDVSSTSVYGVRGANGVILITTKRR
jgi:TonB-dependent starch-binding outer membrane protein SusC